MIELPKGDQHFLGIAFGLLQLVVVFEILSLQCLDLVSFADFDLSLSIVLIRHPKCRRTLSFLILCCAQRWHRRLSKAS
jgi:hypothetical protein